MVNSQFCPTLIMYEYLMWKWLSIKSISFCFRNKLFGQNSSVAISVWFGMCNWIPNQIPNHIPNQTEIATEEFCPKSLLRKQNEIDFIESHFQILHHLKIVQIPYVLLDIFLNSMFASDVHSRFIINRHT